MNQSKKQPIKGWVKASEKLPGNRGKYICRLIATKSITTLVYFGGEFETSYPLNTFEYLDETPIQSGEERWISVEDYCPDERLMVLAINKYGFIRSADWEEYTDQNKEWFKNNFTHWQPLPKPPSLLSSEQKGKQSTTKPLK